MDIGTGQGLSDAFNKGIGLATGDVIGWCSADDYYLPGVFKIVARCFGNDPALTVLYGDHRYIDSDGAPKNIKREIGFDLFILKYLHMNYIRTSTAFWQRTLHVDGFWFNKTLHYAMDYDFMLRVAVAGYRIEHVSTLFADFRLHPMAKSADRKQLVEHEQIARIYVPGSENLPPFIVSVIHQVLRGIARTKRTCKRLRMGHYYDQFWRS